jgi:hypothetical protein
MFGFAVAEPELRALRDLGVVDHDGVVSVFIAACRKDDADGRVGTAGFVGNCMGDFRMVDPGASSFPHCCGNISCFPKIWIS